MTVRYGGLLAVDDVTLRAGSGALTGLIGPNGAGKTTFFNACTGMVRPTGGTVSLGGVSLDRRSPSWRAAHGLGRTFQRMALFDTMTTLENVSMGLECQLSARDVLGDLVLRQSDILLHNFGPAAATALGLGYDDVRRLRPDIIYAAISAFGSSGPDADRTGFDPMAQMASGAAAMTGPDERSGPIRTGVPWVDHSTGLAATVGILAALRHRDRTGEGQIVECALLRTAVSYTAPMVAEAVVGGQERPRLQNQLAYYGPANLYPCRDGRVYIVALSGTMWRELVHLLERPELADDAGLATAEQRYERRAELDQLIEQWTAARTVAEATGVLAAHRIPCSVYRTPAEVPDDPQVQATDLLPSVDLGPAGLESVPVSVTPFSLSALKVSSPVRPPSPGEDNAAVYGELLGYSSERIAALTRDGII